MTDLSSLRKDELLARARAAGIRGRSRMTKAELVAALEEAGHDGTATSTRGGAATDRRRALQERFARFVDHSRRCTLVGPAGHVCGLPVVAGRATCALHDRDVFDVAIPLAGRLGFDTWPLLWRHLLLADYATDPVGLDPVVAEMAWHLLNRLYFDWFHVEVEDVAHVPMAGPAVLAANHGGAAVPYDALMLALAVLNEAPRPRRVRVVGTEIFAMLPFVSHLYRKVGGAYADRADVRHLLRRNALVGVFPEGERGFMKPAREAYRLRRFGAGGFVALAEEAAAPVVPVAILGSEEVHPAVAVSERLAEVVRVLFPAQRVERVALFLNPIPLPVRWRIRFLEPLEPLGPSASPAALRARAATVRARVQEALDDLLARRRSVF